VTKEPILTVTISEEFMAECISSVSRTEARSYWPQIWKMLWCGTTRHDGWQHRTGFDANRK